MVLQAKLMELMNVEEKELPAVRLYVHPRGTKFKQLKKKLTVDALSTFVTVRPPTHFAYFLVRLFSAVYANSG